MGGHVLTVLSLNLAHGRAERFHQALIRNATIHSHLEEVASLLDRVGADVVAVQEADGPSFWSGGYCHVKRLAERASYDWHHRGTHVKWPGIQYGTGILSRRELIDTHSQPFARTIPTPRKGLVIGTVSIEGMEVDVYSVHLDFARPGARRKQVRQIVDLANARKRPVIIAGDLNSGWKPGGAAQVLSEALDLHTWRPDQLFPTFPSLGVRIDWVLVSRSLAIHEHRVLADRVSDHRAILARVGLR
mgnify:CR=1 FL=1